MNARPDLLPLQLPEKQCRISSVPCAKRRMSRPDLSMIRDGSRSDPTEGHVPRWAGPQLPTFNVRLTSRPSARTHAAFHVPLLKVSLPEPVEPVGAHRRHTAENNEATRTTEREVSLVLHWLETTRRGHIPVLHARRSRCQLLTFRSDNGSLSELCRHWEHWAL